MQNQTRGKHTSSPLVFISYADSDAAFAKRLATDLRDAGVSVWLDLEEIQPGAEWSSAIVTALESAAALIFIGSRTSVDAAFARKEVLSFSEQRRGPIIPLKLETLDLTPTLEHALSAAQWIDFRRSYDEGLVALVSALPPETRTRRPARRDDVQVG